MRAHLNRFLAILLTLMPLPAWASATYTMTFGNYTAVDMGSTYTTGMHFTGWVKTWEPLPANLVNADVGPTGSNLVADWYFSDGVHTFTPDNAVLDMAITPPLVVSTDGTGEITDAAIYVTSRTPHAVGQAFYGFEFDTHEIPVLLVYSGICSSVEYAFCADGTMTAAAHHTGIPPASDVTIEANPAPTMTGALGTPVNGSVVSGVGVISGFHCTSKDIAVFVDGVSLGKAGAGTTLKGTLPVCGRTDTGYSLLYNFNNLANGEHLVTVYADGVLFGANTVTTFQSGGVPWLAGAAKTVQVPNFPQAGQTAVLDWVQSYQNFLITDILDQ
jgi:hypothetical protein